MTIVSLVVMMTSCSKSEDYVSAIPSDAVAVAKIDLASLVQKSAVMNTPDIRDQIDAAFEQMPENVQGKLNQIKENPDESGIDFRKPVYLALTSVSRGRAMVVASVKDRDKLEELMALGNEAGAEVNVVKHGAFSELDTKAETVKVAFGDNSFVISFNFNGESAADAVGLLNQKSSESILSNDIYKDFIADKSDFSMCYDYGTLMKSINTLTGNRSSSALYDGAVGNLSVNFENGEIVLNSKMDCDNADYQKLMDCYKSAKGKFASSIPENSYLALQVGFDNLGPIVGLMKEQVPGEQFVEMDNALVQNFGMNLESILNSISGDLAMFVAPQPGGAYPCFGLGLELKDDQVWKKIQEQLDAIVPSSSEIEKTSDGYVLNLAPVLGADYALTFVDNKLSLMPKNAPSHSFMSGPYSDVIKNGGVVIDIEGIVNNPTLQALAQQKRDYAALLAFGKSFKAITAEYKDPSKPQQCKIIMANDKNALASIVDAGIDAFMKAQMN